MQKEEEKSCHSNLKINEIKINFSMPCKCHKLDSERFRHYLIFFFKYCQN